MFSRLVCPSGQVKQRILRQQNRSMEDIDSCNNRGFHFDSSMDGQNDGRAVDGTDECHDERRNGGAMQNVSIVYI